MTLLDALIIGLVQGLTEFLPISSSAHLILAFRALGISAHDEDVTAMIAIVQLGTLLAVLAYFAKDLWNITRALFAPRAPESSEPLRLLKWMVVGTIPIVAVGLALKPFIEGPWTKDLRLISAMLAVWAILLAVAERVGRRARGIDAARTSDACIIGAFQCFALVPGSSRSGTTLTGGLFAGLTREAAARLSFLLSIPAIGASSALQLKEALERFPRDLWLPLAVATVVSAATGFASIAFLLRFLKTRTTLPFVVYRLALAAFLVAMVLSGRWSPR